MAADREDDAPRTPHTAEAIRRLEALPAQADAARVQGLQSLQRVRSAKAGMLGREQARLAAKYGPDHPRVLALAQQLEANRLLVEHVTAEAARAATPAVEPDPKAWILHGRVVDGGLVGQPELTLALYDARGSRVRALGFAHTDATGYFRLTAAMGGAGGTKPRATGAPEPSDAASSGPVYAHVLDARSTTLAADPRPLGPSAGRVDYLEIVLGLAKPSGGKPPRSAKRKTRRSTKG